MNGVKKVSFPSFTHYNYAFKYFMENGVGARYIMPPQMHNGKSGLCLHSIQNSSRKHDGLS